MTSIPILFHDPTSEPSRAVRWFCLEASIPLEIKHVFLTRDEHWRQEFLAVNPRHQVPALSHDDLALGEATAIIRYLAELHGCRDPWLGSSLAGRARVNLLLSWYHTNLRLKVTLNYVLPALLAPAYRAMPRPTETELAALRRAFDETLRQTDAFLQEAGFLAGDTPTVPDLLFGSELFALDADPDRDSYLHDHRHIVPWLARLRALPNCEAAHRGWNAVAPLVRERLEGRIAPTGDPSWVAACCEQAES